MNYLDIFDDFYVSLTFPIIDIFNDIHIDANYNYMYTDTQAPIEYVISLAKDLYACNIPFIIDSTTYNSNKFPMYYIDENGKVEYNEHADDPWRIEKTENIDPDKVKKFILLRSI